MQGLFVHKNELTTKQKNWENRDPAMQDSYNNY
jgi:hypothetical protein